MFSLSTVLLNREAIALLCLETRVLVGGYELTLTELVFVIPELHL